MPSTAPFYDGVFSRPENCSVEWITTRDHKRLRALVAPSPSAWGVVHIHTGRTEYIEKYSDVITALQNAGLSVVTCDWRGQGLSDRLHEDPNIGHIDDILNYQHDVEALFQHAEPISKGLPKFVIGHSMGGAIALRTMLDTNAFKAACFSGPMWGIYFSPWLKPLVPLIMSGSRMFYGMDKYAFGTDATSYLYKVGFPQNNLTFYEPAYKNMIEQITRYPQLSIAGPSLNWIEQAVKECRDLVAAPAPSCPSLVFVADQEQIVSTADILKRADTWDEADVIHLPHTKHECFMESPSQRDAVIAQMIAHFRKNL